MRYAYRSKLGILNRSIRGLAGLLAPFSKDSLTSGDKGHECRVVGPRCRPQDSQARRHPPFAALSARRWFRNMWRRFEPNKIYWPKSIKQFRLARLEGQPRDRGTQIRPAFDKHSFLDDELKLHQLNQFSFACWSPSRGFTWSSPCAPNR